MDVSIASLNINKRINTEIYKILMEFKCHRVDILLLQETTNLNKKTKVILENSFNGIFIHNPHPQLKKTAGTTILISNKLKDNYINHTFIGNNGRCLRINLNINDQDYHITNVYYPNERADQRRFTNTLLSNVTRGINIVGGDFNFIEDVELDVARNEGLNTSFRNCTVHDNFIQYKQLNNLCDLWRINYPTKKEYTHIANNKFKTQCRLDRIYTDQQLLLQNTHSRHIPCAYSDHDYIVSRIKINNIKRGKGAWKLNNTLLKKFSTKQMADFWEVNKYSLTQTHPHTWWDNTKNKIKKTFIAIGKQNKIERDNTYFRLIDQLAALKTLQFNKHDVHIEIKDIETQIQEHMDVVNDGIRIRSRQDYVERGEKNTNYFYSKLKQNNKDKTIYSIKDDSHSILTGSDMEKFITNFYKNLYTSENPEQRKINDFLENTTLNKIEEDDNDLLSSFITPGECLRALKSMKNNKTPGPDGLTKEFYLHYWDIVGDDLTEVLNNSYLSGELPDSMKGGHICLLFKKGKRENLKNWRPISLLNIDYKILSKVIANRFRKIMFKIIDLGQGCGVKGRTIKQQLLLIREMRTYLNNNNNIREGFTLISLDQEKAFDRVEHPYIYRTLEEMGFSQASIQWVRIMYNDISSNVVINGNILDRFYIDRSMRQGCPLSMLLFVIGLEPLLRKIQSHPNLTGYKNTDGQQIKYIAYADDVSVVVKSHRDITILFKLLQDYGEVSGAKINRDKTELFTMGNFNPEVMGRDWKWYYKEEIKLMGIIFSNRRPDSEPNFNPEIEKIRKEAIRLASRTTTIYGRKNIINTLLLPKIWFKFRFVTPTQNQIKTLNRILYTFLWKSPIEKISRETLELDYSEGGLRMLNIGAKKYKFDIEEILEFVKNPNQAWCAFLSHNYGIIFKDKIPGIYERSKTHTIELNKHQKTYAGIIAKILNKFPYTWQKITDRQIKQTIKPNPSHIPTEQLVNPYKKWPDVLKLITRERLATNKLPNFVTEVNFFILHNIIPTKTRLRKKYGFLSGQNIRCRLCDQHNETTTHILTKCKQTQPLKKYIHRLLDNKTNIDKQIALYTPSDNIQDFHTLSWFRYTIINLWTHKEEAEPWEYIFNFNWDRSKYGD